MRIESAEHVEAAHHAAQLIADGRPEVAFVGRSNVGKSSLLNRLLGRRGLARTSSTPGRTRAVHYFLVNRRFYFVDLPGYGYAKAAKTDRAEWASMADGYLRRPRRETDGFLVVLLIDGKVGATDKDLAARDYLDGLGVPYVVVATKVDRLSRSAKTASLVAIRRSLGSERTVIPVSSETGEGIPELWKVIGGVLRPPP